MMPMAEEVFPLRIPRVVVIILPAFLKYPTQTEYGVYTVFDRPA